MPLPITVKKRPLLPPDFVRAMLAGHSALGLAFAALIYVVCLTGTLAVFGQELARWEQPDGPVIERTPAAEVIAATVRAGYARAKAEDAAHDIYIAGPLRTPGRLQVHYDDHEKGIEGEWLADARGELTMRIAVPWSEFVAALHAHLHLPKTWGKYLVGLTGVALFSSLISGLLSHPRILKDAFMLRWGGSRRLQEADIHNRLGVWGLPFHVVVSATGALLGLSSLIIGVLALAAYDGDRGKAIAVLVGPRPTNDATPAAIPDIGAMIRSVQINSPDAEFASAFIQHIGTAGQTVQLGMHTPGQIAFSSTYRFRADGTIDSGAGQRHGVGRWILGALQPLHYGWFGGVAGKLLYGILGLALAVVTHSGVAIWLLRRREKGRPAPGWEKAWAVVGWSQPLAFGTTALAAMLGAGAPLPGVYLATVGAASVLAALSTDGRMTARVLRLLCALTFLAVAATHAMLWRDKAVDQMAWTVDLAIVIVSAIILSTLVGRRKSPRLTAL